MEIGSGTKAPASQAAAPSRADQVAAQVAAAARTELPPEATVHPMEAVRFEPREGTDRRAALDEAVRQAMERHLTIDPKTRAVVTESIDPDTGKVVRQVPDETLLKLRVYARELREAGGPEPAETGRRAGRVA